MSQEPETTKAQASANDTLRVGTFSFNSRLFTGTGKYESPEVAKQALKASGCEVVTVAVRRVNLDDRSESSVLGMLQDGGYTILPNTAGCYTSGDALRTARLARELLDTPFIKLEVIGDEKTLFPDNEATLEAAKELVKEGFTVLPYVSDDLILAKKLRDIGCAAVMPLAAPIGSGLGICNPYMLEILRQELSDIPLIVDAGVGTASDAARAMEIGCDAILMNTAIAGARDAVAMARAMNLAVEAGRLAFQSGRIERKLFASASSPLQGVIGSRE